MKKILPFLAAAVLSACGSPPGAAKGALYKVDGSPVVLGPSSCDPPPAAFSEKACLVRQEDGTIRFPVAGFVFLLDPSPAGMFFSQDGSASLSGKLLDGQLSALLSEGVGESESSPGYFSCFADRNLSGTQLSQPCGT